MQIDNYTSSSFQSKTFSAELISNQTDFPLNPQSPVSSNQNLPYQNFDQNTFTDQKFFKSLNSDSFFPKIRPDSSKLQQSQNQYYYTSASKSLNRAYLSKQSSQDSTTLLKKLSPSNSTKEQRFSFQFKSKGLENPLGSEILRNEHQSLKKENAKLNGTVSRLRNELEEKVSTLQKFNQLMKIKYSQLKDLKAKLEQKQVLIQNLQEKCSTTIISEGQIKLKQLLMRKNKELDQINAKINNLDHENFKNQVFQNKINHLSQDLESQKTKLNHQFLQNSFANQKIKQLEEQVAILQFQNQKTNVLNKVPEIQQIQTLFKTPESSPTKNNKQSVHLTAFQQALKVQMKQIQQLKLVIDNSSDVIQKLRDNLVSSRRQLQELRGQMKILDFKASSERKKLIMEYRLQIHDKDNEISTFLKRYKTLEQKYKNALIDIKAKDDFFRQYLLGRTSETGVQESIETILNQYTENFENLISLKAENQGLKEKLGKYRMFEEEIENL